MSTEKGNVPDVDSAAPLDLRVKKEVKTEPKVAADNVPLNLSKAPTPPGHIGEGQKIKDASPKPVKRESPERERLARPPLPHGEGGRDPDVKLVSPGRSYPRQSHGPLGGYGGKADPIPMGVGPRTPHPNLLVVRAGVDSDPRYSAPLMTPIPKQRASESNQSYVVPPRQLVPRGLKPESVGSSIRKATTAAENNHSIHVSQHGLVAPSINVGPTNSAPAQPALSPSKFIRQAQAHTPMQVHEHHPQHGKLPSPRSGSKKSGIVRRDYGPVQAVPPAMEVISPKVSPNSGRHGKVEKEYYSPHAMTSHGGGEHMNMGRLVAHGPARSVSNASHASAAQKTHVQHAAQPVAQHEDLRRHHIPAHPMVQQELMARGVVLERGTMPKPPRTHASPHHLSPQHAAQHRAGLQSHGPTPPVEEMLRRSAALSQAEGMPHHPLKAQHSSPGALVSPRGQPPPAPSLPTHPLVGTTHPPQVSVQSRQGHQSYPVSTPHAVSPRQVSPHQLSKPSSHEKHAGERIKRLAETGQGYIPPGSEYYRMAPVSRVPQTSSAPQHPLPPGPPPIVQTPGPPQSPQGYHHHHHARAAPFAVNPFVSLSIAIDCQRATEQDSDGDTALHISIVQDKPDMGLVRRLIELVRLAGKSVDIFNYMQQTPLHLSCIMKDPDIIRLLVEAGANPNEADRNGQTASHHACKNDNPGCLGAILRYSQVDVNLNIRNYEGYTPLHLAAMIGNPTLVTMLLEKGADINSKDSKNGWTPLFHAVTNQDTKLVHKMLGSGAEVNVQSYSGNTVLHVATGRGFTDIVKILVHYGADMSLKNTQWDTPATITTDKNMSSLLRGLGAGSPQTPETSSPSSAAPTPTLPMPLNDAYLIRPTPTVDQSGATGPSSRGASPSKTPMVTTMTTERLKGSANEVYTVTRSVTRQDGASPSPDGQQQRVMHKQLQERLRHSIQSRKVGHELRGNEPQLASVPSEGSSSGSSSSDKMVVVMPNKKEVEGQFSVIIPAAAEGIGSPQDEAMRFSFLSDLQKRLSANVRVIDGAEEMAMSPTHRPSSAESIHKKSRTSHPTSKSTPDVLPSREKGPNDGTKESIISKPALRQNASLASQGSVEDMDTAEAPSQEMIVAGLGPPSANGDERSLLQRTLSPGRDRSQMVLQDAAGERADDHMRRVERQRQRAEEFQKMSNSPPKGNGSAAPSGVESESEIRARMLSLQYKNSHAILGNRYERKLDTVGSEQEHEAVTAMLAMGSGGFREHPSSWNKQPNQHMQDQERHQVQTQKEGKEQKQMEEDKHQPQHKKKDQHHPPQEQQCSHQTCDADSTVKAEPVSPTPLLSSTSDDIPPAASPSTIAAAAAAAVAKAAKEAAERSQSMAKAWPQNPPVLEREVDPYSSHPPSTTDDDAEDDEEPDLVIDESFRSNSRKRTRPPPKSSSPSSMAVAEGKSAKEQEDTSSDESTRQKSMQAAVGDSSNIVWKKKAMMAMKRKRTEKSSS